MASRKTKKSTGSEERKQPTTGIADLDRHIDDFFAGPAVAVCVMLDLAAGHSKLIESIRKRLYFYIEKYIDADAVEKDFGSEVDADAKQGMEISWWIGFWQGIQAGHKKIGSKSGA